VVLALGLVTLIALVCLIPITALGLRPRGRLTLLALTSRLIAIALVTLLSLPLLAPIWRKPPEGIFQRPRRKKKYNSQSPSANDMRMLSPLTDGLSFRILPPAL
jgi:hypothetical protein